MPRLALVLALLLLPLTAAAQELPSIKDHTKRMEKLDGFFPLYWDANAGKVWLEIPQLGQDFLYFTSLPAGLGSNDIGLDRGLLGTERIVRFERVGPKVLLVAPNLDYRATSDNAAEVRAVRDAFAEGVVWGFTAGAEEDGRVLVDATDFIVRDGQGIARRLKGTGQGTFRLDAGRSAIHRAMTKSFPQNTEMEARVTFTTDSPGGFVRQVAADPYAVTLRLRHSFVQLPEAGYEPRVLDPRSGYFGIRYVDYATPIGAEKEQRYIVRHRLEKTNPNAAQSTAVAPIVYYLDNGTPEPVRSALLDGARWWSQAFEAAGFIDAFRVEVLPEDADPMDVRYHMIQWVHRATRGWSYGRSIVDPRTGEIIKGHVSLGSLRVRQDYLLAEGLLAPYADGVPADDPMLQMALARIRQLSAHEIGHTLGIAHNFAASVNGRASVMDYPAPLATVLANDEISLADAYDTGIGEWDVVTVRYGYSDFPAGTDEKAALDAILDEAHAAGLRYISDTDARPAGAAHPLAHLWDNGTDAVAALTHEMRVRQLALARFSEATIRPGRPLATLEEVLVPLYLRHRYQVEATVKLVGGVAYDYTLRGDGRDAPAPVPAAQQQAALRALLATLTPEALRLPEAVRSAIPPRPPSYGPNRELFDGYTGLTFDPYAPAEVASSLVLGLLIHPQRAARLVLQNDLNPDLPALTQLLTAITEHVWQQPISDNRYDAELQRIVQQTWTDALLSTAARANLSPGVRARLTQHLRTLTEWLEANPGRARDAETVAHRALQFDTIERFLLRLYSPEERRATADVPPGSPIGDLAPDVLRRQTARQAWLARWQQADFCTHLTHKF